MTHNSEYICCFLDLSEVDVDNDLKKTVTLVTQTSRWKVAMIQLKTKMKKKTEVFHRKGWGDFMVEKMLHLLV